ncbi:MAG: hypothetical protein IJH90_04450 [Mogibacterium sp.]|nr:hypothetical protein [Mogibacterium sp.]
MNNLTERDRQAEELSQEIIALARNTILVNLRFMDRAIGNLRIVPDMNFRFAGNGAFVFYSPWSLINMYHDDQNSVTRNLIHCALHNVLRHSIVGEGIDRLRWDLACDIAAENSINELGKDCLRAKRETAQAEVIGRLREELPYLTAERIYSYLNSGKVSYVQCYQWSELFHGDDHDLWYGTDAAYYPIASNIDLEQLWKDIARRMQTELELFDKDDGALTQNLREINRIRYNYTEFLKRFSLRSETMKVSDEEFDNIYYTYGIELYGDIPLIEPLEYRDSRKIRDFVIAIDTSGSVEGAVVQKFVQHTHDILTGQNSFDTRTNLYILQCDDAIRDSVLITCREDFDNYLSSMEIKGLGRTDFRPVFAYVDKLIEERKLTEMRGLLYFTDGKGTFPSHSPDYDVAFIIHNDTLTDVWVPEWAMKVDMPTEEFMKL